MTNPDDEAGPAAGPFDVGNFRGAWDRSLLPDNMLLGARCYIESPRLLEGFQSRRRPGLVLGDDVHLYLGGWGGRISVEKDGYVQIGDRTVLAGVQIMCQERVEIGSDVTLSYNSLIADCDFHPRAAELRRADAISGAPFGIFTGRSPVPSYPVFIGNGAFVGINAVILKGVRIGAGARILPGAVVTRDVAAGATVGGNPCREVGSGA